MTLISCLLFMMVTPAGPGELAEIRKIYYQAYESRDAANNFFRLMRERKNNDPLMAGYEGMAYLLQAKFAFNPYTKLTSFNKGKALLDKAILKAPEVVELRFMRFCVQSNAPSFLRYSSQLDNDKTVIIKGWEKIADNDLKGRIKKYMAASSYCNDYERAKFK